MNWDALAAIGEVAGAGAVVVSLVYLAIQVRDNTRSTRSATRQAISDSIAAVNMLWPQNKDFSRLFIAHVDGESLDRVEELQLSGFCYLYLRTWENVHFHRRSGMLSSEEWRGFRHNLKALLQIPAAQDFWRREQAVFVEPFQKEVDAILTEIAGQPVLQDAIWNEGLRKSAREDS